MSKIVKWNKVIQGVNVINERADSLGHFGPKNLNEVTGTTIIPGVVLCRLTKLGDNDIAI